MDANSLAVCSVVTKNYIAYARNMVNSFLKHHPDGHAYLMIVDRHDGYIKQESERFTIITPEALGIPNFKEWTFRLDPKQMCMALKAWTLWYVLETYDVPYLCHIDNDIHVYSRFDELIAFLADKNVAFTPHYVSPNQATVSHHLANKLIGLLNTGIVGVRNTDNMRNTILPWWAEHSGNYAIPFATKLEYRDQAWADLILMMFEGVGIFRDPAYNVAPWNAVNRPIDKQDDTYLVEGRPLKCFHFSKFRYVSGELPYVTANKDSDTAKQIKAMTADYKQKLTNLDYKQTRQWPYGYAKFNDGMLIPTAARSLWMSHPNPNDVWANPFDINGPNAFRDWVNRPTNRKSLLTRLARRYHNLDDKIRDIYPAVDGGDQFAYALWFTEKAGTRFKLDDYFIAPIRRLLPAHRLLWHRVLGAVKSSLRVLGLTSAIKKLIGR